MPVVNAIPVFPLVACATVVQIIATSAGIATTVEPEVPSALWLDAAPISPSRLPSKILFLMSAVLGSL